MPDITGQCHVQRYLEPLYEHVSVFPKLAGIEGTRSGRHIRTAGATHATPAVRPAAAGT